MRVGRGVAGAALWFFAVVILCVACTSDDSTGRGDAAVPTVQSPTTTVPPDTTTNTVTTTSAQRDDGPWLLAPTSVGPFRIGDDIEAVAQQKDLDIAPLPDCPTVMSSPSLRGAVLVPRYSTTMLVRFDAHEPELANGAELVTEAGLQAGDSVEQMAELYPGVVVEDVTYEAYGSTFEETIAVLDIDVVDGVEHLLKATIEDGNVVKFRGGRSQDIVTMAPCD